MTLQIGNATSIFLRCTILFCSRTEERKTGKASTERLLTQGPSLLQRLVHLLCPKEGHHVGKGTCQIYRDVNTTLLGLVQDA